MGIFGEASVLAIVGFFITIISFVLQLVGFSTPLWNYSESGGMKAYNGLWETCNSVLGCSKFNCDASSAAPGCTDQWKAVQAMEVLAFIVFLVASVMVILKMCVMKDKSELRLGAIGCCFAAGVFALIGIILYATETYVKASTSSGFGFHFSFSITIIAAIGGFIAGGLLIVGK